MYQPQFVKPPCPPGFHDEDFVHYFDQVNNPSLGVTIPAGDSVRDIQLQLETDADFIARGISVIAGAAPQFREPGGFYLSSDFVALAQSYRNGVSLAPSGMFAEQTVALEPEIHCPGGSNFSVFFENPTGAPVALGAFVAIFGVKRRRNDAC